MLAHAYPSLPPSVTATTHGKLLIVGGELVEVWDPTTGGHALSAPQTPRFRHSATALDDGRVVLIGGLRAASRGEDPLATHAELWDGEAFREAGAMIHPRFLHVATRLRDGRIFITGGVADERCVATTELFDPSSETFTSAAPLRTARAGHTVTCLPDGRVLVVGGHTNDGSGGYTQLASTEIFDPDSGTWRDGPPLLDPREDHAAALLSDGAVLVVGNQLWAEPLAFAEILDPGAERWRRLFPDEPTPAQPGCAVVADDRVLIASGSALYLLESWGA
jgi:hypothetical protein